MLFRSPGNIKLANSPLFVGEVRPSYSDVFRTFRTPTHGFRAIAEILLTYQKRDGIKTIGEAINRYAPPSDNNPTEIYSLNVARECGVEVTDTIDFKRYLLPMLRAISRQELGEDYYSDDTISHAIDMALELS